MVEVRLYPTKIIIDITTVGERMLLSWFFYHHDYEEVVFGDTRIKSKWFPCEDGDYYRNKEHGKYIYDVSYVAEDYHVVELVDLELDGPAIMDQLRTADAKKYNYEKFVDTQYVAGAKYNRKDPNIDSYTNVPVTRVLCSLGNPLCGQEGLSVCFECDEHGETKVMQPVAAFHSNIVYANIEHIGCDEMSDAEVFHLTSKADPGYVVRLEIHYDDILKATKAYRMKLTEDGTLVHE